MNKQFWANYNVYIWMDTFLEYKQLNNARLMPNCVIYMHLKNS